MAGIGEKIVMGALAWAWKHPKAMKDKVKGVQQWWQDRNLNQTLMIGPGGVGKTTLTHLISGDCDLLFNPPGEYEESLGVEKTKVNLPGKQKATRQKTRKHAD